MKFMFVRESVFSNSMAEHNGHTLCSDDIRIQLCRCIFSEVFRET
jgi:hypothetical protein